MTITVHFRVDSLMSRPTSPERVDFMTRRRVQINIIAATFMRSASTCEVIAKCHIRAMLYAIHEPVRQ